jgi:hypothetical protein
MHQARHAPHHGWPPGIQAALACSTGVGASAGISGVSGLFASWTSARPGFVANVTVVCTSANASVVAASTASAGFQAWAFNCPPSYAISEMGWTTQILKANQSYVTSLVFKCARIARLAPSLPIGMYGINDMEGMDDGLDRRRPPVVALIPPTCMFEQL